MKKIHRSLKNVKEAKMTRNAPMYVYATENVSGYYNFLKIKNKKVLTICGSGDQVLNAYFFGAKEVTGFDLNIKSKYVTNLKICAIKNLDYKEFLEFFGEIKPNVGFKYKLYKKLEKKLDQETRKFFNSLYKKFNYNGLKLVRSDNFRQRDDFGHGSIKMINAYLKDVRSYKKMGTILRIKKFKFLQSDASDINSLKKYDLINLSNVPGYIIGSLRREGSENPSEEMYKKLLRKILKKCFLKSKIIFYVYSSKIFPNRVAKNPLMTSDTKTLKFLKDKKGIKLNHKKILGLAKGTFDRVIILQKSKKHL